MKPRHLEELRISGLRNLTDFVIRPQPTVNVLVGPNGAGKTSVLEGMALMAYGRSFRPGGFPALLSRSSDSLEIFGLIQTPERSHRLGMGRHRGDTWSLRVDGETVKGLAMVARHIPMSIFQPDSHELIQGGPETRRRLIDWLMFHVEPPLVNTWRRYQRALKQRNELLRRGAADADFLPWESILAAEGEILAEWRGQHIALFEKIVVSTMQTLSPGLLPLTLRYRRGWEEGPLAEHLVKNRPVDRTSGFGRIGPHRFDFQPADNQGLLSRRLSRGQQKVLALAFTLSHAKLLAQSLSHAPILCLDDLASELDQQHQVAALETARSLGSQVWITGVEPISGVSDDGVFHVEQLLGKS